MPLFSQAQKTVLYNQGLELERHFQRDKIIWTSFSNEARVEVEVVCKNGKKYILRVCISPDFPNSCPPMVVISPDGILRRANGSLLGLASRQDHVLTSKDGYTRICYFRPGTWMGNKTLYQVIKKGLVWLEAYELHLQTGNSIDLFIKAEDIVFHDGVPLHLD